MMTSRIWLPKEAMFLKIAVAELGPTLTAFQ